MQRIDIENPTRKKIVMLLKKHGGMTTDELSRFLNITPMGIRQHLLALEKRGIITYELKKGGIGRPGFIYSLTEGAENLFPKSYHRLVIDILEEIEKKEGIKKVEDLFRWRKARLLKERQAVLGDITSMEEKVKAMSSILDREGYLVEYDRDDHNYYIRQYNCPLSAVARRYSQCCKYELQLYRDLFSKKVTRKGCIAEGSTACVYSIPKR
ncbi:MAG TPA: winged helix-turn-helix transcriptional regulator [Nitrospirae bacterium]|nr:winged helix-turn-helix transcriptional regulator [Nitrospirota bacterium]